MINKKFDPSWSFVNKIRGYHDKNGSGQFNDLIASTIIKFAAVHLPILIQICLEDPQIKEICNLPILALTKFWQDELNKLSITTITSEPFNQILTYFENLNENPFQFGPS